MKNIKKFNDYKKETNKGNEFDYMFLARLQADCEYYLGWGDGSDHRLHFGNVEKQISEMKKIWEKLPVKPEWLSLEQIEDYEKKMLAKREEVNKE